MRLEDVWCTPHLVGPPLGGHHGNVSVLLPCASCTGVITVCRPFLPRNGGALLLPTSVGACSCLFILSGTGLCEKIIRHGPMEAVLLKVPLLSPKFFTHQGKLLNCSNCRFQAHEFACEVRSVWKDGVILMSAGCHRPSWLAVSISTFNLRPFSFVQFLSFLTDESSLLLVYFFWMYVIFFFFRPWEHALRWVRKENEFLLA